MPFEIIESTNLSGIRLSNQQKNYLADLVLTSTMKPKNVAQHFYLTSEQIRYYAFRKRRSSRNYYNAGRVRKIDEISHDSIKNMLIENGETLVPRLRAIIKEEGKNTYFRKNQDFVLTDR